MTEEVTKEQAHFIRAVWLQAMLQQRCVAESHAVQLHRRIHKIIYAEWHEDSFNPFLDEVEPLINQLDLAISKTVDQYDGITVLALVNTKGDEIAQVATHYSATEMAYIKRLIKEIFTAEGDSYSITSAQALRTGAKIKPQLTQRASENLLKNLVKHQWIVETSPRSGKYALSSRALLELNGYLKNEFPDHVMECTDCSDILTRGIACSTRNCETRLHRHCEEKRTRVAATVGGSFNCSGCNQAWRGTSIGPESAGSGRRPAEEYESDEDEDEEEDVATRPKRIKRQPSEAMTESSDQLEG